MPILNAFLICLAPIASDGDTLRCANTDARIRVWGIQAPETGTAGAVASRANLAAKASGGLVCETKGATYNRISAVCYNGYGVDIGRAQIQGGYAKEWCSFSRNYYKTCA